MTGSDDTSGDHTGQAQESGPGAAVGKRITGESDPRDPDGLITLDDLPNRLGSASDLGDLTRKAREYGDASLEERD
ncbi:hypothetical protein L1277_002819 [Okibacterium sp. HSC-33S16]|uniref:hypothetical protein n=1 Tax=Okibacterium sp. HSC-33S16 TaxID=2910965 RepID=UPI00209CD00F|nr:hypothetical protein [Okibacterium sp. HSC-33S16]MCP2032709.1 hypothetical protein [Okibacterium sp. HSC-33S16]